MLSEQDYSCTSKSLGGTFHIDPQEVFEGSYEGFVLYETRNELDM
jgi:hypothetical protein